MNQIDWKNESAGHFEKHAEERLQDVYPWLLRDFIEFTGWQIAGRKILEIGCGPGFMLQQFSAGSPALLTGVDASFSMLHRVAAAARAPKALLVQADACSLPFAEASFDAVFSRGSVFFWADLHAAFAGIKRCLRPGGQALIGGGYGISTPQAIIDARQNPAAKVTFHASTPDSWQKLPGRLAARPKFSRQQSEDSGYTGNSKTPLCTQLKA
ncbi:MAG TPA: class I SAM-dependent methyltransferase [Candidatus Rifleibacterium sp.]|nr:class I SAM-dependent methyltransferase [Candidatus Rifleibacterium sp.]